MKSIDEVKKFSNKQFAEKIWGSSVVSIPKILTPLYAFAIIKPYILLHFLSNPNLRKREKLIVLDFGCGTGNVTKILSNYFSDSNIIGIDISPIGVKQANDRFSDLNFVIGDCQHLPFENNIFDLIYSADVFGHIPDLKLGIQEFSRILKTGGEGIIFSETNGLTQLRRMVLTILEEDPWIALDGHISLYSDEELKQMLTQAGLKVIDYKYYPEIRIPVKRWDTRLDVMYPELLKYFKFRRPIGKFINYLRSSQTLKYLMILFPSFFIHILLHFQKKDVGGLFIYVKKIERQSSVL